LTGRLVSAKPCAGAACALRPRNTHHVCPHLQPRKDRHAVRQGEDRPLGARIRAREAAPHRPADWATPRPPT